MPFARLFVVERPPFTGLGGAQHEVRGGPATDAGAVLSRSDPLVPRPGVAARRGRECRPIAALDLLPYAVVDGRIAEACPDVGEVDRRDVHGGAALPAL